MIYRQAGQQTEILADGRRIEREPWVSTVVLADDELDDVFAAEVGLHQWSGWVVTANAETRILVARKRRPDGVRVARALWFVPYDPATDGVEAVAS